MEKRAIASIGSMLLLISVLLTTSIGVGVFIQMTNAETQQALVTGRATSSMASTSVQVYSVRLEGITAEPEHLALLAKLSSGSGDIVLADLFLEVATQNTTTTYRLGEALSVDSLNDNGTFTADYLERGDAPQEGVLLSGDILELHLQTVRSLVKDEPVRIRIVPAGGLPSTASFYMPSLLLANHFALYP